MIILTLIGCMGGYAYNYRVLDKRGISAVPGSELCCNNSDDSDDEPDNKSRNGYGAL